MKQEKEIRKSGFLRFHLIIFEKNRSAARRLVECSNYLQGAKFNVVAVFAQ